MYKGRTGTAGTEGCPMRRGPRDVPWVVALYEGMAAYGGSVAVLAGLRRFVVLAGPGWPPWGPRGSMGRVPGRWELKGSWEREA